MDKKMKTLTIKNVTFGTGIPKIAVPVTDTDPEEIVRNAEAAKGQADLIELRIDAFLSAGGCAEEAQGGLEKLLSDVRRAFDGPILFTLRTGAEGGLLEVTDEVYAGVLARALKSGCIDLIDIEFARTTAKEIAERARAAGVPVVFSRHDFRKTPKAEEIAESFRKMEKAGAAIAKGAFMPESGSDVDEILRAAELAGKELSVPFILIAMGEKGRITRTHGEVFGSCLTFASLKGRASAPGQIDAGEMRKELIRIHEARERKGFIFLIGFMGTGKSSVGRALKKMRDLPLIEMDENIEKAEGMPISRIFETRGQEAFRDMETEFLAGLCGREGGFVSCGGGAVLRERNRVLMRGLGTIVLLTASPETIYERLKGGIENRPNIRGRYSVEGISELMETRRAAYTEAAGRIVATDGLQPAEIAGKILEETGSDDFV